MGFLPKRIVWTGSREDSLEWLFFLFYSLMVLLWFIKLDSYLLVGIIRTDLPKKPFNLIY